jgi:Skp family chaperone for outer membrane proteins
MRTTTRVAGLAAGLTLTLGTLGSAAVATPTTAKEPCARQQAQVDRATDALARVTAVFERQKEKVADARDDVTTADDAADRTDAKRALAKAKAAKAETTKAKRAQVQRLAKAQDRLDACTAAQPAEETATS